MSVVVVVAACLLASGGAMVAEWWRLRQRYQASIARSYGSAASVATVIVLTQAVVNHLLEVVPASDTAETAVFDLLVVILIGPALHGVVWLLLLVAWDTLRRLALSGSRSPRI